MHAEHVADLMSGLASWIFVSSDEISLAYLVGLMHDVGKTRIPTAILQKPGKLTDEEYAIMKTHAALGAQMLANVEGAALLVPIVLHHHERFDGRGYPHGLAGSAIPLFSRMLALCDAFDAMTTFRCYREPVSLDECLAEMKRCSGTHFDPDLCQAFVEYIETTFGLRKL